MKKLFLISMCACTCVVFAAKPVTNYAEWALKIADSEMKRSTELWMSDSVAEPVWNYSNGLMATSYLRLFYQTFDTTYYRYVKRFAEEFVSETGEIKTYNPEIYSLEQLYGGNFLFDMFTITEHPKYLSAIRLLRSQLYTQPRVRERAFWYDKKYPYQLWLEGLYMVCPFYTRFAAIFDQPIDLYDDVIMQFRIVDKYTFDAKVGLNYHGWDESHRERWANPANGRSSSFWSRSLGFYMMAIVEVLEYLPVNHPDRFYLIKLLNRLSATVLKYQDGKSGMWWQVTDMPRKKGNFIESSSTSMFSYALAKGVNKGYLPSKRYKMAAIKAFDGLIKHSVLMNNDSTYSITHACAQAGLGGNPYRDGGFQYYVSDKLRTNDSNAIGPFILAAIELSKLK